MADTDQDLRSILTRVRRIAMVGFSPNPTRESHIVAQYLAKRGYEIYPVNPGHVGKDFLGRAVVANLSDIEDQIDMVDIFRRSEFVAGVVDEALAALPGLQVIWMQLGVEDETAAATARAAGIDVVMNHCPKIEYHRLIESQA